MQSTQLGRHVRIWRLVVLPVVALVIGLMAFFLVPRPLPELSQSEFLSEVRSGHVHKVEIEDHETITGVSTTRGAFRTSCKSNEAELIAELRSHEVEIVFSRSGLGLI